MKKYAVVVSFCVLLACSARLQAQDRSTGPLKLSAKVEVETTDNRDSARDEVKESNTDFMVKPRAEASFDLERTTWAFFYEPTLRYRTDPRADQNDAQFFHDLGLNLRHSLTPSLTFKLDELFNHTDDPSVDQDGTTLRRDSSFIINRVYAALNYDINRLSRVDVSGEHRVKRYSESELSNLDEESVVGGVTAYRAVSRTSTVLGEARLEDFAYDTKGGGLDRDFTAASYGVGIESEFMANCRTSLRVGYTQMEYSDNRMESQGAPYVRGMVLVSASPLARFTVSGKHGLRDSDVYPFASQTYTDLSAGLELDASAKVTLDLSGTYRVGEYDRDALPSGSEEFPTGDETTVIVKAGVAMALSDGMSVKLSQQYEDEDSDVDISFTRNATRLTLAMSF